MGPGAVGPQNAERMVTTIEKMAKGFGLEIERNYPGGESQWGKAIKIKIVLFSPGGLLKLGVECIYQEESGTAYKKFPSLQEDMDNWGMPGVIVFDGDELGGSVGRRMLARGGIPLPALEGWVKTFFGLV
jgi:hypothetical protein